MASKLLDPRLVGDGAGDCAAAGEDVVNNETTSINAGKTPRMQAKYVPGETLVELWRVDMYISFVRKDRQQHAGAVHSTDVVVSNCS